MPLKTDVAKTFQGQLALFADDLQLNQLHCRTFCKKVDELESGSLTARNKRAEFAKWVESRIQAIPLNASNPIVSAVTPVEFDQNGTRYRILRTYDEILGLRSSALALIDAYHDGGEITAERALELIAFIKKSSAEKSPCSLLECIKECYKDKRITAIQAAKFIDLMERLPSRSLMLFIADWYAEKIVTKRDIIQILILIEKAIMPRLSGAMPFEGQADRPEGNPLDAQSVEFKMRLAGLNKERGISLNNEAIALFFQIIKGLNNLDVDSKREELVFFLEQFTKCLALSASPIDLKN